MKIMFLDESGDHSLEKIDPQYPVFCLAGVIIDENEYEKVVSPSLDSIKLEYWQTTDVFNRKVFILFGGNRQSGLYYRRIKRF